MDDLGFNKIMAAILATGLGFMGLKEISHMVMHVDIPETPAYALALPEPVSTDTDAIEIPFPSPTWIAAMDATRGAKEFKKCVSCHNAENGGKNGQGPNLWDIVGKPIAQKAGFKYSSAATSSDIVWDYEALDAFLTRPSRYLKGTNMSYNGLKKEEQRAAVIEYLRLQSDNPLAQPQAAVLEMDDAPLEEGVEDLVVEELISETPEGAVQDITEELAPTTPETSEQ